YVPEVPAGFRSGSGLMPSLIAIALILATVALIAVHTARLIRRERWNTFDPLNAFWGGVLVVYVIQPLSHGALYESWHSSGVMERTCFWVFFAMCFVVAGYECHLGPAMVRLVPAMPQRLHAIRMQWVAYVAIAIGLLGYVYQFASAGGFANWTAVG